MKSKLSMAGNGNEPPPKPLAAATTKKTAPAKSAKPTKPAKPGKGKKK